MTPSHTHIPLAILINPKYFSSSLSFCIIYLLLLYPIFFLLATSVSIFFLAFSIFPSTPSSCFIVFYFFLSPLSLFPIISLLAYLPPWYTLGSLARALSLLSSLFLLPSLLACSLPLPGSARRLCWEVKL